mgnify:CR=1 FL=1
MTLRSTVVRLYQLIEQKQVHYKIRYLPNPMSIVSFWGISCYPGNTKNIYAGQQTLQEEAEEAKISTVLMHMKLNLYMHNTCI